MPEQISSGEWVDRYVRDKLSPDEMKAFELELLESEPLQQELETVLAMRGALALDGEPQAQTESAELQPTPRRDSAWQPLAMAATLVLAVLSTVMWWRSSNEVVDLEGQVQALGQPMAEILTVAVPIMRSTGGQTPDVIVQKPGGHVAILLDVELGLRAREQDVLDFALVGPDGTSVLAWQASPTTNGRTTVVINSDKIPASELWLQISDVGGEMYERRLLEFRE